MGITGRYDFQGIQKAARAAIDVALATTSWGAAIIASSFKPVFDYIEEFVINWMANRGLIFLNIGVNIVDGVLDQKALDNALQEGIARVMQGRDKLTPAEGKAIDDDVRAAFDKDADLDASDPSGGGTDGADGVSKLSGPSV